MPLRERAHLEVLEHRHPGEDAAPLRRLGHAHRRDLVGRHVAERVPLSEICPVRGCMQPGDRLQRRALAGAVRADQRDDLALLDLNRDALQGVDVPVVGVDVVDLEHGCHGQALPSRTRAAESVATCSSSRPADRLLPRRPRRPAEVGLDHPGVALDLAGVPSAIFMPVVEHRDRVGDAHHHLHVVLDQQDRQLQDRAASGR